jgi:hypothetical protein
MCGKAFGLPASPPFGFWALPNLLGRSPKFITNRNGSAERFRTSGGIAESRESLLRQSHSGWIARVTRFCKRQNPNPKALSSVEASGQLLVFAASRLFEFSPAFQGRDERQRHQRRRVSDGWKHSLNRRGRDVTLLASSIPDLKGRAKFSRRSATNQNLDCSTVTSSKESWPSGPVLSSRARRWESRAFTSRMESTTASCRLKNVADESPPT